MSMAVLKVKINGEWVAVGTAAKGDKGDPYVLTEVDKDEIKNAVLASLPVYDGSVTVE